MGPHVATPRCHPRCHLDMSRALSGYLDSRMTSSELHNSDLNSNFSRCVFVFVFSTQGCNIVYAARSAHLPRFSALIDVQRRPSKAAMHSRYSTAYCTCSGFNLVARCVFKLVMLSVGPWHQSVGRLARGNASYGDRPSGAIARPGDVFHYQRLSVYKQTANRPTQCQSHLRRDSLPNAKPPA